MIIKNNIYLFRIKIIKKVLKYENVSIMIILF